MHFALANLDNGLFFDKGNWTFDFELAQAFACQADIVKVASQHNVKNAAAALIAGDPPRVRAFYWITDRISN